MFQEISSMNNVPNKQSESRSLNDYSSMNSLIWDYFVCTCFSCLSNFVFGTPGVNKYNVQTSKCSNSVSAQVGVSLTLLKKPRQL